MTVLSSPDDVPRPPRPADALPSTPPPVSAEPVTTTASAASTGGTGARGRASTPGTRAALDGEQALLTRRVRRDRAALEDLLSADFHEFGVSGHAWERADIVEALLLDPDVDDLAMADAEAEHVSDDVVLVRYVSTYQGVPRARRTSLWRLEDDRWRMVHHQGSPLEQPHR